MIRKVFGLAQLFAVTGRLPAQNLVPNGDFECGDPICLFTQFPSDFRDCNWYLPTSGTSDKYSSLTPNPACYSYMPHGDIDNVPSQPHLGSQAPRSGSRFVGIYTYFGNVPETSGLANYREYIQVQLSTPLEVGEYYCAEMWVSAADRLRYASNNLGMYFHDAPFKLIPFQVNLGYSPQVVSKDVISDAKNWVLVRGMFKATFAATYVTIGNFATDAQTVVIDKGGDYPNPLTYESAYYYIDDVSVEKVIPKSFVLSGQQSICEGQSTTLHAQGGLSNIRWTTLSDTTRILGTGPDLSVKPSKTIIYRVTGFNCMFFASDTIKVAVNPLPKVMLRNDTTICRGSSVLIDAGAGYKGYRWNDGELSQKRQAVAPGVYGVQVTTFGNCTGEASVTLSAKDPPKIELGKDSLVCDSYYALKGPMDAVNQWSDGSTGPDLIPDHQGKYWCVSSNECGTVSDTVYVSSVRETFVPNVVTANGDGLNESLRLDQAEKFSILILNRWGNELYRSQSYSNNWPGGTQRVEPGTYYYHLKYAGCSSKNGWIEVMK
ncbi:MAG: gliding motility-associated C-terminal domain-containing protein [Bacteroidetes bacterium]|nr:gliding motility-associated C-terminal domain-containing protein [Bacteroidota bacterium]